jgi:hypothetical protein
MRTPIPPALRRISSDEYRPLPWRRPDLQALCALDRRMPAQARRLGMPLRAYTESRRGTAATLREINVANGDNFYDVPLEAELDPAFADEVFAGQDVVIDVQTHLVRPSKVSTDAAVGLYGFLQMVDADRWGSAIDPALIAAPQWASLVFGQSETAVALLTSLPGPPDDNVLTNVEIAAAR